MTTDSPAEIPMPEPRAARRTLIRFFFLVAAVFLALFIVFEAAGLEKALAPDALFHRAGPLAALASLALLLADVVLPVPSSVVMVANGALFGFWGGAAISAAGGVGSSLLAYALGRWLRGPLERRAPAEALRAQTALEQWGTTAVLLTRPLPLLAETVAVVAGAVRFDPGRFALGSVLGALPVALIYAAIGAYAVQGGPVLPLLAAYLIVAVITLLLGRARSPRRPDTTETPHP